MSPRSFNGLVQAVAGDRYLYNIMAAACANAWTNDLSTISHMAGCEFCRRDRRLTPSFAAVPQDRDGAAMRLRSMYPYRVAATASSCHHLARHALLGGRRVRPAGARRVGLRSISTLRGLRLREIVGDRGFGATRAGIGFLHVGDRDDGEVERQRFDRTIRALALVDQATDDRIRQLDGAENRLLPLADTCEVDLTGLCLADERILRQIRACRIDQLGGVTRRFVQNRTLTTFGRRHAETTPKARASRLCADHRACARGSPAGTRTGVCGRIPEMIGGRQLAPGVGRHGPLAFGQAARVRRQAIGV